MLADNNEKTQMDREMNFFDDGFIVYSSSNEPIGVTSKNGFKNAKVNPQKIPPMMKKYLIEVEDKNFYQHSGIDYKALIRAIYSNLRAKKIVQGGSTITQQLARNLIRNNEKTISRKIKEANLAFSIENKLSKEEIINLYFNEVFWGRRNYGLRSASIELFSKEPQHLNVHEQIYLLTLLRGPNLYLKNNGLAESRMNLLGKNLHQKNIISLQSYKKIKKGNLKITNTNLEIFQPESIGFISEKIDTKNLIVNSNLNVFLQRELTDFIKNSSYPISVLGISDSNVICSGSTYGSNHPFLYRSNVGSTLKPFIYTFLRMNGIEVNQKIKTTLHNSINWKIRENTPCIEEEITLKEALFRSNNNVFVNASYMIGVDRTLDYLSSITNINVNDFFPSTILGATKSGMSLYELLFSYQTFLTNFNENKYVQECLSILKDVAYDKFGDQINIQFIKTGTTNCNKERFAIVGYANKLFAFLRQENEKDDTSKEGGFIFNILDFLKKISTKKYKWE